MTRNHADVPVSRLSIVPASRDADVVGRVDSPAYCLRCDRFVQTRLVPAGSSGVKLVLAGLAAFFLLPELINMAAGTLALLSALFGAALALYVARRRPFEKRVCGLCGSPYIHTIERRESPLRRAA
jgi:hypothetical protein